MAPQYRRPLNKQSDNQTDRPPRHPQQGGRFWLYLFGILLICSIYYIYSSGPEPKADPVPTPGTLVAEVPVQKPYNGNTVYTVGNYTIKPVATLSLRARVLNVRYYKSDREADLSPMDFALGWGSMSDSAILNKMRITQRNRWYFWRYDHELPINNDYIIQHSANMHMIPANEVIADQLKEVRKNQIINLKGYLVQITGKNNYYWNSSLTRNDTGNHSCEVVFVEGLEIE